jgi:integral membrane protein
VTSPSDPATPTGAASSAGAATSTTVTPAVLGALKRYRVIAYVVGVMLLVLVFVAMPVKYAGDNPALMNVVGPLHGFLYVVYLLATFDLARRLRWGLGKMVLIALAGTIPFLSFVAERKVTHELTRTN